ncbi:acrylyl-CoA reductase family protein [Desmospora profundinema]|uniref:YhdH/YhfP family quinone oxidoreductase n=1 Tax=Desmospora profundinema TaxID=1571184 RepID=A0ABU1IME9_9BACL|nr:acryloyl-CoA reductase [Desmospora profundinema]MDR6225957.1 putative YhdH/YhfP family quinone oxidoreductase [Desmospora profundinema]
MAQSQTFRAWMVDRSGNDFLMEWKELTLEDLPEGDVLVKVEYSGVNYKDGLASIPHGRVIESYPMIPGIDLAGQVVQSRDDRFPEGMDVIVASSQLGVSHYGGFSRYARVPADWVVPLPEGLTLKEAMVLGTAGFTAAMSVLRMEENGLKPDNGPVLVTGATGGVGSTAIAILSKKGYTVAASTGKEEAHEYLRELGAVEILGRQEVKPDPSRPLARARWAGAVDPVGGDTLSYLLSTTRFGGSVAVSGLTGGTSLSTTVFPFILRGINLLGIDSAHVSNETRRNIWGRLAADLKPESLQERIGTREIPLEALPETLSAILQGEVRGRTVVKLSE